MGEKSVQKKQFIVETARQVFVDKGFKNVTMKDIVDACGISRGGLYLYFENTVELYAAVLEAEMGRPEERFADFPEEASAAELLLFFLKEQKKEILRKKGSLAVATYEYFFEVKPPKKEHPLRLEFSDNLEMLKNLIKAGMDNGEFYSVDPEGTARNILFVLEGLKICAQTMGVSENMVDRELLYIVQGLVCEE